MLIFADEGGEGGYWVMLTSASHFLRIFFALEILEKNQNHKRKPDKFLLFSQFFSKNFLQLYPLIEFKLE